MWVFATAHGTEIGLVHGSNGHNGAAAKRAGPALRQIECQAPARARRASLHRETDGAARTRGYGDKRGAVTVSPNEVIPLGKDDEF